MFTPNEAAARVWDDYLHRFGAEAYVTARYIAAPPTIPRNEDAGLPARSFEADAYHSDPRLQTSADPSAVRARARRAARALGAPGGREGSARFPQHPDQHDPEGPILLAVDRESCELADPVGAVGAVEVQEHEDVEQFGAGSRP